MMMGAVVRSRQIAGALRSVLDLSVAYAKETCRIRQTDREIPSHPA